MTRVRWNPIYGELPVAIDHRYLSLYWHERLRDYHESVWFSAEVDA